MIEYIPVTKILKWICNDKYEGFKFWRQQTIKFENMFNSMK